MPPKSRAAACNNATTQCGGCNAHTESKTAPRRATPSRTFSTARVARARLLFGERSVLPTNTQRVRSPTRPGSRKFAMFPIPSIVRHEI